MAPSDYSGDVDIEGEFYKIAAEFGPTVYDQEEGPEIEVLFWIDWKVAAFWAVSLTATLVGYYYIGRTFFRTFF